MTDHGRNINSAKCVAIVPWTKVYNKTSSDNSSNLTPDAVFDLFVETFPLNEEYIKYVRNIQHICFSDERDKKTVI